MKCLWIPVFAAGLYAQVPGADHVRAAATKSIALLQRSGNTFYKAQDCFSCHHLGLPLMALREARERGITVDEGAAHTVAAKGLTRTTDLKSIDNAVQATNIIDPSLSDGQALLAAWYAGVPPSLTTAVYARRIANWQEQDGHWATFDSRPPQSYSTFTATAVALRALQLYMPSRLKAELAERVDRASAWLLTAEPASTEDRAFRLFGLAWAGAADSERSRAAKALLEQQRDDGGWAQVEGMPSDAYSTGQVLAALHQAATIPVSHPAWHRGLAYLLHTQRDDGSWQVSTRQLSPAPVSPPYFETGFPYGHDQFISAAATAWAATALMTALPKSPAPSKPQALPELSPAGTQRWMETALFGSAPELESLLEKGLDPNSKTPGGTTLLMMAAADPEKVKLLLGRGAEVNAKAKTGFTALMVASVYRGTSASLHLLLEHGAEARPGKGVLFNASPLFFAAMAGDRDNVTLLSAKGAEIDRRMVLLGQFATSPLFAATSMGNADMVKLLIAKGASIREEDEFQMTALDWAVLGHRRETVKALAAAGSNLNHVDKFGYTPLLYAATVNFGDADVLKALLDAGADPNLRAKGGKSALAQARHYQYARIRAALEESGARE